MRNTPNVRAERFRVHHGSMASTVALGNNGAFMIPQKDGPLLGCIICDGTCLELPEHLGWEHVSVGTENRCPTWDEMCLVKRLFWRDDEVVFQLHPAEKDWISAHPYCLHLWRNRGQEIVLPPKESIAPAVTWSLACARGRLAREF